MTRKQDLVIMWQIAHSKGDAEICKRLEELMRRDLKTAAATIRFLNKWSAEWDIKQQEKLEKSGGVS